MEKRNPLPTDIFCYIYRYMKHHHHSKKNQTIFHQGSRCQGRIWLQRNGATFLGTGRIVLLERIHEHGSIAKAARSMKMSYKHAWDLVDAVNRQAKKPLVITSKGGKGGGGTRLTQTGEEAIRAFRALQARFQLFLEDETDALAEDFF